MKKPKPQLSLFPNTRCHVCDAEVKDNVIHCDKCTYEWLESIKLNGFSVFIKK